jgi:catalase-peroxidase
MTARWEATEPGVFTAHDRATGQATWSATRVDLIFASNAQLRALSEAYATDDASGAFVEAFVAAWAKVMDLDRFDLK